MVKISFSGDAEVKNLPANAGGAGLIPGSGRSPEEGNGNPLPVFLPGESHGQRNLGRATVHRVTKSWIRRKRLSVHNTIDM